MNAARLYDAPEEFAAMIMRQLEESLKARVRQREGESLSLEIEFISGKPPGKIHVNLHETYRLYRATGDLNAAVDYLNNIVRNSNYLSTADEIAKLDPAYIYPAIRDERYVEEAGSEISFISDEYLPGLRQIYLEIKGGCTKIVSQSLLKHNPGLTETEVRAQAVRNLQKGGWQQPSLSMQSPLRPSCIVDVYEANSFPLECQFLLPEWAKRRMPSHYVVAFTNRTCTVVMRSKEPMDTARQALKLVCASGFPAVVKANCNFFPYPVSDRIYWVHQGKGRLLALPD